MTPIFRLPAAVGSTLRFLMSRVLKASCNAEGKVFVDGAEVPGALVLTQGKAPSEGLLILEGFLSVYFATNTTDLVTLIEKLITALDKAVTALNQSASALTSIDNKPTGGSGSAPTPVAAGNVSQIQSAANDISSVKNQLSDLKGALK